jgi:type IV secretion system protein VirB9
MKQIIVAVLVTLTLSVLPSCRTVHFDVTVRGEPFEQSEQARSLSGEEARNRKELEEIAVEEELKEVDVEKTVVYIDRPVYSPERKEEAPSFFPLITKCPTAFSRSRYGWTQRSLARL